MKKFKFTYKNIIAILFVVFIMVSFVLSFITAPTKILGGLARGYLNSPEDTNVLSKIGNGFKDFDSRMSEYYVFHDISINSYGAVQNLIDKKLIDDVDPEYEVLKLNNGYLTFKHTSDEDLTNLGNYLIDIKSVCDKNNINLMYINKLSKTTDDKDLLPANYPYAHKSNYGELKKRLLQNNIGMLDIQDIVDEQNIDKYCLFFKTDHHWTPKTGIWVSQLITEKLNSLYNYNLNSDLYDISNYNIETHYNAFLGSQGKRVGYLYAGADNLDVITPKYDTDMSVKIAGSGEILKGTFEDTIIHRECITPDNLLNKDRTAYDTYMLGNHDLIEIKNNNINNGKRALLILDSFGCVVAPYLSQNFQQLDCIDLRSYTGSLKDYIEETSPDVVIYMATEYQKN